MDKVRKDIALEIARKVLNPKDQIDLVQAIEEADRAEAMERANAGRYQREATLLRQRLESRTPTGFIPMSESLLEEAKIRIEAHEMDVHLEGTLKALARDLLAEALAWKAVANELQSKFEVLAAEHKALSEIYERASDSATVAASTELVEEPKGRRSK